MPNHAINKQVFDFTCSSESVARRVRDEFVHFTAVQINRLIDAVLTEQDVDGSNIRIDAMEIELGDVPEQGFGNMDMLNKFRTLFTEKLAAIRQANSFEANRRAQPVPLFEVNLEVVKSFILHGDVPWWIDKKTLPDPDQLLRELVASNPEAVKIFLEAYREDPVVLSRIATQYKPATKALLYVLSGLNPVSAALLPAEGDPSGGSRISLLQLLLVEGSSNTPSATGLHGTATTETKKQLLVSRLLRQGTAYAVQSLTSLGLLSVDDTKPGAAAAASGDRLKQGPGKYLREWLAMLSLPQLQFLHWYLAKKPHDYPPESKPWPDLQEQVLLAGSLAERRQQDVPGNAGDTDEYTGNSTTGRATAGIDLPLPNSTPPANQTTAAVAGGSAVDPDKVTTGTEQHASPPVETAYKVNQIQAQIEAGPENKQHTVQSGTGQNATLHTGEAAKNEESGKAPSHNIAPHSEQAPQKEALPPATPPTAAHALIADTGITGQDSLFQQSVLKQTNPVAPPDEPSALKEFTTGKAAAGLGETAGPEGDDEQSTLTYRPAPAPASGATDHAEGPGNTAGPHRPEPAKDDQDDALPGQQDTAAGSFTQPATGEEAKTARIAFLMRGLNSTSPALFDYMHTLPGTVLEQLRKNFTDHARENVVHRKNVRNLLEHPHLLKYNLVQIFATLPAGEPAGAAVEWKDNINRLPAKKERGLRVLIKRIEKAQTLFTGVLKGLSWKETIILQDVLAKKTISSRSEKNLVQKILLRAPADAIRLLHFMAGLPEDKLEQLQPPGAPVPVAAEAWQAPAYAEPGADSNPKKFYIANAGLCLVALYLPGLFHQLGYIENKAFKNKALLTRALYVLQYIATGRPAAPEYVLQLNKLLCGYAFEQGIALTVRLSRREKREADELIESVIANWKALKNTSAEGFRQSFLQRRGILFENGTSWTLQVERQGHDLLLGTISWGYTMIKLPWMKKMIQVEW